MTALRIRYPPMPRRPFLFQQLAMAALALSAARALSACAPAESVAPAPVRPDPPYVPPAEACDAPALSAPTEFAACNLGGGIFGAWALDEHGLPAYEYGLDQHADPRAAFFNTEGADRRDHWAAFGNDRVNALAYNDGPIALFVQDRGPSFVNAYDPENGLFAGGYGFVDDGAAPFCTAYFCRPPGSKTRRVFGMGHAASSLDHGGLHTERTTFAPPGGAPFVISQVTLENTGDTPRKLSHYEVWDVGRRPIEINWAVSGMPFSAAPAAARTARDARNGLFEERVAWDPAQKLLGLRRSHAAGVSPPPPAAANPVDYYPDDVFLAVLAGDASDVITEDASFLGSGAPGAPDAVTGRKAGQGTDAGDKGARASGLGQPRMLAIRTDLTLAPGEKRTLAFAYGVTAFGAPWPDLSAYAGTATDQAAAAAEARRLKLFYFAAEEQPFLHRELAWHASQIEASVGERQFFQTRVVPQGSAYLYLHGADGAARDLGLFTIPLVYTDPSLARDELSLHMRITHAEDGRISYSFQGHGVLDDALGIHKQPSDLDLFLLWAACEYVGATGDLAFLDSKVPFYPPEAKPGATAWDHLVTAVRHLIDKVGTGPHGLVRVGDGDWSDGIVFEAKDRALAIEKGESVPNTQMAAWVLPLVADLAAPRDAKLADEVRVYASALRASLPAAWAGDFYGRAFFGDGKLAHADSVDLEAQVWALIGDTFASEADRDKTIEAVLGKLDVPSPAGATLRPGGQVWPAISGLWTWGVARSRPDLAFSHLARNTLAAHARAYPDVWYGIWSAPDGLLGPGGDRPGEAWFSQVTPMTDFPVQNNNAHAMPLLAALRVAGVEATAAGLSLSPRVPSRKLALRTALLDLDLDGQRISGAYRPLGGPRSVVVHAPAGERVATAELNGAPVSVAAGANSVVLAVPAGAPGTETRFMVETEKK